ncbi:GNAT family N-acetyltransferase [Curtobacterium luteum]|uniref:Acetyltransferase n=1 Tax=Curtobacterium luteum TaxID=33881 RepID=A0A175RSV7_9MICO|nr:GNAT family N-acetyltransferase [Curtobacterium luteum]KTR06503.1 acetyltransferase [Curtobacterium luteum]
MTIVLRRVTADDWATWRPVRLAALADAPDAFGSRLDDWREAPEHRWRTRLSVPGAIDLLAVDTDSGDGRAIGMASGVPVADAPHRTELISMWVDPGGRRRGVARLLIDAVAAWAAGYGAHELVLSVMPDNRDAREAYARTGFSVADEPGDLLPDGRRELVMRRDLEERP